MAKFKRIVFRARHYYDLGASVISLPIVYLGLSRNIYSLIDGIPFIKDIFPTFQFFVITTFIGIFPIAILLGYMWTKSRFYKEKIAVTQERNPYRYKLPPTWAKETFFGNVIGQKMMLKLFKQHNLISPDEIQVYEEYIELLDILANGGAIRDS